MKKRAFEPQECWAIVTKNKARRVAEIAFVKDSALFWTNREDCLQLPALIIPAPARRKAKAKGKRR